MQETNYWNWKSLATNHFLKSKKLFMKGDLNSAWDLKCDCCHNIKPTIKLNFIVGLFIYLLLWIIKPYRWIWRPKPSIVAYNLPISSRSTLAVTANWCRIIPKLLRKDFYIHAFCTLAVHDFLSSHCDGEWPVSSGERSSKTVYSQISLDDTSSCEGRILAPNPKYYSKYPFTFIFKNLTRNIRRIAGK